MGLQSIRAKDCFVIGFPRFVVRPICVTSLNTASAVGKRPEATKLKASRTRGARSWSTQSFRLSFKYPIGEGQGNRPAFTAALIRSRVRSESESEKNW